MRRDSKRTDTPKKDKKKKEELPPLRKNLSALLTLQTFFVLLVVVAIALAMAMMYRTVLTANHLYGILSMMVPIVLLVSLINAAFSRIMYKYLNDLTSAMTKVADGDFSVRLDAEKKQPFREVYRVLIPDGYFTGVMFSSKTLHELRDVMETAEMRTENVMSPHVSPLPTPGSIGDALVVENECVA